MSISINSNPGSHSVDYVNGKDEDNKKIGRKQDEENPSSDDKKASDLPRFDRYESNENSVSAQPTGIYEKPSTGSATIKVDCEENHIHGPQCPHTVISNTEDNPAPDKADNESM